MVNTFLPMKVFVITRFAPFLLLAAACVAVGAPAAGAGTSTCPTWVTAKGPAAAPLHATNPAVAVGAVSALLTGPSHGRATTVELWQTGAAPRCVALPAANSFRVVADGLRPRSRYHVRLVAHSKNGPSFGSGAVFTTLPAGRIAEGVTVGKVSIGRMQTTRALAVLTGATGKPLRLAYAGAYWQVAPGQAGLRTNIASLVAEADKAEPGTALPAPTTSVDAPKLNVYIATLGKRWSKPAVAADVRLVGSRAVISRATPAMTVDATRMKTLISKDLLSGGRARIALAVSPGKVGATPVKAVVVRLGNQTLTAYLNGKPILTTPVTTGRPALPTPVGSYFVHYRQSPYTFTSPWPMGSAYYYPPTTVNMAMYFYDNDFLHDDPAEPTSAFGAGSEYGYYASHGCVHVPYSAMTFIYSWLPVGATVIVSKT
jgi:lipoprotein-anchoring transpeptidase ErfK/SrfK